jgi:hypothetical protein
LSKEQSAVPFTNPAALEVLSIRAVRAKRIEETACRRIGCIRALDARPSLHRAALQIFLTQNVTAAERKGEGCHLPIR